jgi:hypothetical protein
LEKRNFGNKMNKAAIRDRAKDKIEIMDLQKQLRA